MSPPGTHTPPLVLIHGVGDDQHGWDEVIHHLGEDRPIIRYDLRGHGTATAQPLVASIDDFVDDLVALLDREHVTDTHLVGFSLGGLIAQRCAIREPDRVASLTVIGSIAGRTSTEAEQARNRLRDIKELGPTGVARQSIERWFTADYLAAHPEAAEHVINQMAGIDPEAYTAAYRVLATTDLADQLNTIRAPTLAITGEHDIGSPPRMARLIAESTGGHCVIVADTKHNILQEQAPRITKEILIHVNRNRH